MEIEETDKERSEIVSDQRRRRAMDVFLRWIVPVILLVLTLLMMVFSGMLLWGQGAKPSVAVWKALPFIVAIFMITGAHALGHYLTARRYGVRVYPPYFVPGIGLGGTAGAFTKMEWPITNRSVLVRIFSAGPIGGFVVSTLFVVLGFGLSHQEQLPASDSLVFGECLLT